MKTLVASAHTEWCPRLVAEALRLGSDVHTASNGFDAIDLLRKHRYDVVILDDSFLNMTPVELHLNLSEIVHNEPITLVCEDRAERHARVWQYCNTYLAGNYHEALTAMESAVYEAKRRRQQRVFQVSSRRT